MLTTRNRWPALVAATHEGKLVAVVAYGGATVDGTSVMAGHGLKALLALDGNDLRESTAILVAPFEPGSVALPKKASGLIASVGEFGGGKWTELERITLQEGKPLLKIDADQATCLILVSEPQAVAHWTEQLTNAMCRPDEITGY